MLCPSCNIDNGNLAIYCQSCGRDIRNEIGRPSEQGDATNGIIPYKNPQALSAYYLGLFSIVPIVGIALGIASVILGKMGLKKYRQAPHVKGRVHAWVGIGCGSLSILTWTICTILIIFGIAAS